MPRSTAGAASSSTSSLTSPERSPTPQELFNVLAAPHAAAVLHRVQPAVHPDTVETTVRVVRYNAHGRSRQGVASGQLGERSEVGAPCPSSCTTTRTSACPRTARLRSSWSAPAPVLRPSAPSWRNARPRRRERTGSSSAISAGATDFLYEEQFNRDAGRWHVDPAGHRVLPRPGPQDLRAGPHHARTPRNLGVAGAGRVLLCLRRCRPHGQGRGAGAAGLRSPRVRRAPRSRGRVPRRHEEAEALSARHVLARE